MKRTCCFTMPKANVIISSNMKLAYAERCFHTSLDEKINYSMKRALKQTCKPKTMFIASSMRQLSKK
jgi:hypothetical protein